MASAYCTAAEIREDLGDISTSEISDNWAASMIELASNMIDGLAGETFSSSDAGINAAARLIAARIYRRATGQYDGPLLDEDIKELIKAHKTGDYVADYINLR